MEIVNNVLYVTLAWKIISPKIVKSVRSEKGLKMLWRLYGF